MMATAVGQQKSASENPPGTEPKHVQSEALTSEHFAKHAYWAGMQEVQLSQMALTKTQNTEVRNLAQMIVTDHTQANEELRQIAQRKGINLPVEGAVHRGAPGSERTDVSSSTDRKPAGTTDRKTDTATAQKPEYEQDVGTRQDRATEFQRQRTEGSRPYTEAEARQHAAATRERLQTASGADFDRQYVIAMLEGHEKAISKYQMAAQQLNDAELKQYASSKLPKLREHQDKVRSIAQTLNISTDSTKTDRDPTRTDRDPTRTDRDPAGAGTQPNK